MILDPRYIADTAREAASMAHPFGHKVTRASWSSDTALWTIEALCGAAAPCVYVPVPLRLRRLLQLRVGIPSQFSA